MSYEAWGEPDCDDCSNCDGTGLVCDEYGEEVSCPKCDGTGFDIDFLGNFLDDFWA